MKKIFIYVAIAALALASACTTRNMPEMPVDGDIVLSLQFGAPIQTRATTPGVGLEDAVNYVDCFFYTDVEANPVYSFRDNAPASKLSQDTDGNVIYTVALTAGEADPFGEGNVPDLDVLFNNKQCEVFAVFNSPTAITKAPLASIKTTALENSFAHEGPEAGTSTGSKWVVTLDEEASAETPKYFVMTGAQTLTRSGNNTVTGTVEMNRVAAKIAVDLKIKKSVTDASGKVWTPMLGGRQIRLYPQNVAKAAIIGGADETPSFPDDFDLFTYKEVILNSELTVPEGQTSKVTDDGTNYVIASQQDFYTFPMTWIRGDDNEPFIKIIVPWSNTTSQKEIYYKVMLPWTSLESNKYYKLTVNVSVLGTEGEPEVILEPLSAMVVNWQGDSPVNGTISAAKYLSVERGVVTATSDYDTAEGRFEFYTPTSGTSYAASDPVTVRIKEIKQKNLKSGNWEYLYQNFSPNSSQITSRGIPTAGGGVHMYTVEEVNTEWVQKVGVDYLQIGHQLNSTLTSPLMDVTPYYYTVVLSLPADIDPSHEYDKTVTFVQWPEIYVVEDPNSQAPNNTNKGYVYVNGSNSNNANYGGVAGLAGSNTNPNMYILTISVSDRYIIGDPRSTTVNNGLGSNSNNWSAQARRTWGTGNLNRLTNYHETSTSSTNANMIAPKIRVASSYGVTSEISRDNARKRCASYQEDGIPAGRWRLPTEAEVRFICTLSALGRIPYLYGYSNQTTGAPVNSTGYYWTATNCLSVNNYTETVSEVSRNSAWVRCVYDEWFWGDAMTSRPLTTKTNFTWGDAAY